jgi:sulfur carrier protein
MVVNGNELEFTDNLTVSKLLGNLKLDANKVVVEVDLNIVYKDAYESTKLSSDSKVEIIRFVGGG